METSGGREISVPEGINIARLLRYTAPRLWLALLVGIFCALAGLVFALYIRPEYSGASRIEVLPESQGVSLTPQIPSGLGGLGDITGSQLPDINRLLSLELSRRTIHELGLEVEISDTSDTPFHRFRQRVLARVGKARVDQTDLAPVRLAEVETEPNLGKKDLYLRTTGGGGFEILDRDGWLGKRNAVLASGSTAAGATGVAVDLKRLSFKVTRVEDSKGAVYLLHFRPRAEWLEDFRQRLDVGPERRSSTIVLVSFHHFYPEIVRETLQSLVHNYDDWLLKQRGSSEEQRQSFLSKELDKRTKEMLALQSRFYDYREQHQLVDLTSQSKILLDNVSNYDSQINQNEMTRQAAADALANLDSGDSKQFYASPFLANRQDSMLGDLVANLSDLEAQREAALKIYTEKHSEVQGIEAKIDKIRSLVRQHLRSSIDGLTRTGSELNGLRDKYLSQVEGMPAEERQLFDLQRDYEAAQELIAYLKQQQSQSELTSASLTSNLRLIDDAEVGDMPSKPRYGSSVVFGGVLGVALGLMALLFMFLGHSQVFDEDDAAEAGQLLGSLQGRSWKNELPLLAGVLRGRGPGAGILLHDTAGADSGRLAAALYETAQGLGQNALGLLPAAELSLEMAIADSRSGLPAAVALGEVTNAAQLLRSDKGRAWLKEALSGAELVCAGPPGVKESSLGQLLAVNCGQAALLAVRGVSSRRRLGELARSLELAGVRVAGVVLVDPAVLKS